MSVWTINPDPDTGRPLEVALTIDRDTRVCFLCSDGSLDTAKLIAAAPELLEALVVIADGEGDAQVIARQTLEATGHAP